MSLRLTLRDATRDLHHELDALLDDAPFADAARYARFLRRQAAALVPLEAALEAAGVAALLPDWPQRRRSAALQADLALLGELPRQYPVLDQACDPAASWGLLYVLEGSRLGARQLKRALDAQGDTAMRAASNYLAHGEGLPLWPDFLRRLEALDPAVHAPAQAGARQAFGLFLAAARTTA
ncbi:biliverdin-producing heme oxygenase [Chitinolyticbacter meiyuanensis]|uniref:biliverdin-producing heme oxygenase n=1 Tax=Chitinolyticbacter meiyuanensis TaxID=682798 RepID=UPI0011E59FF7|nr:biliverdin-producing heme oxygenase [Chitinolyticbacter meiyuanensis]